MKSFGSALHSGWKFPDSGLLRAILVKGVIASLLLSCFQASAEEPAREGNTPDQLLLQDYRPRSIFNIPQSRIEKARIAVIDVHSHAYAKTPAEVDRWVNTMDAVGISKTVILTGATGQRFDELVTLYSRHPQRFVLWCGIDYTGFDRPGFGPAAVAELERCVRQGAKGVGELSDKGGGLRGNKGGMHMDDPRMDMILEKCADLRLPVNIHVGEDRWMYETMDRSNDGLMNAYKWRIPPSPQILPHDEVVATLDRTARRHPRTVFIACHFANCCSDLSVLGRMLDEHRNLFADISARYGETAPIPRHVARFFEKYQDRLLYGTDMGFDPEMYRTTFRILETDDEHFYAQNLFNYHWPLHGFGLKSKVLRKVYSGNARRILFLNASVKDDGFYKHAAPRGAGTEARHARTLPDP